eukprot:g22259.t1
MTSEEDELQKELGTLNDPEGHSKRLMDARVASAAALHEHEELHTAWAEASGAKELVKEQLKQAEEDVTELAFQCSCSSARPGDQLRVVGEGSSLGDWDPHRSTAVLQAGEFPLWQITLPVLVTSTKSCWSLEYKYVILREDGSVEWEEPRVSIL